MSVTGSSANASRSLSKLFGCAALLGALAGCASRGPVFLETADLVELPGTELRVALFGDQGTGLADQAAVGAALGDYHAVTPLNAVFLLGDNFYERGVSGVEDPQFDSKFQSMYPASTLDIPFYVVLGNHDWIDNPSAQYAYSHFDPTGRWKAKALAWVLPFRLADGYRVDFILVDSHFLINDDRGPGLAGQIIERLGSTDADLRILLSHHPLYSSGIEHGDTPGMIQYFSGAFEDGALDASFAGHDHDMEVQSREVDGDSVPEIFVVAGCGSRLRPITAGPYSDFALSASGFCAFRITGSSTSLEFIDSSGTVVYSSP